MAQAEVSGREKSKILWEIADSYIRSVRKWQPGTYKLIVRGKMENYNIVDGYLLNDAEEARKYAEENPNIHRSGHYPSEFMLLIDFDQKKVVKDIRPGQKEQHPRP